MGELNSYLNSFYVICKRVTMLILKFQWDLHWWTEREVESLIHIFTSDCKNVCNKNIEHHYLITEGLIFFNNHSDLAVFVKCPNALLIYKWDNGSLHLFILIRVRWIVINTLLTISKSQAGFLISFDLWIGIRGHKVKMSLFLWIINKFWDINL